MTRKRLQEEEKKKAQEQNMNVINYMIDDYENGGKTRTLLESFLKHLPQKSLDEIFDIPIDVLLANFTLELDGQRTYVEHIRCCGVLYLDSYKVLNAMTKLFKHTSEALLKSNK